MSAQPEALRIADECEQSAEEWLQEVETRKQAAAELRRLHAEVLEQCRLNGMGSEREAKLMAENEAKDVLLRKAWAVIRWQCFGECRTEGVEGLPTPSEVDTAIRQHLNKSKL